LLGLPKRVNRYGSSQRCIGFFFRAIPSTSLKLRLLQQSPPATLPHLNISFAMELNPGSWKK